MSDGGSGFRVVEPLADEGLARPVGCWIKGAGGTWKRMRRTKKTDGSLVSRCGVPHVFHGVRWKRLRFCDESLGFGAHDDKRGLFLSDERVSFPREGVG